MRNRVWSSQWTFEKEKKKSTAEHYFPDCIQIKYEFVNIKFIIAAKWLYIQNLKSKELLQSVHWIDDDDNDDEKSRFKSVKEVWMEESVVEKIHIERMYTIVKCQTNALNFLNASSAIERNVHVFFFFNNTANEKLLQLNMNTHFIYVFSSLFLPSTKGKKKMEFSSW